LVNQRRGKGDEYIDSNKEQIAPLLGLMMINGFRGKMDLF
jgi:hypothetical protein